MINERRLVIVIFHLIFTLKGLEIKRKLKSNEKSAKYFFISVFYIILRKI